MNISLPDLPYSLDALEPYVSSKTLEFHYGRHHKAYVEKLNNLIIGTDMDNKSLETIITKTVGDATRANIFNNAAQTWNHSFYWQCMSANGGGEPTGKLADMIRESFGDYDNFFNNFITAGITQFGSGWVWLVLNGSHLQITKTSNANTPLAYGSKPILTVDVWEHSYYLDYQNNRPEYLSTFLKNLVNWDFVSSCL